MCKSNILKKLGFYERFINLMKNLEVALLLAWTPVARIYKSDRERDMDDLVELANYVNYGFPYASLALIHLHTRLSYFLYLL